MQEFRVSIIALLIFLLAGLSFALEEISCEAGFRPIEYVVGTVCVPESPLRVIALEWTYVEDILALGVLPVGVAVIVGYGNWVNLHIALDENVIDVGTRQEPNL